MILLDNDRYSRHSIDEYIDIEHFYYELGIEIIVKYINVDNTNRMLLCTVAILGYINHGGIRT